MAQDLRDLYRRAASWTIEKVDAASDKLADATTCDDWDVRALLNHMLQTQRYFVASAQGREAAPPTPKPPSLISAEPARDFVHARDDLLDSYSDAETLEKRGQGLGVAFSDILIHGWDLATSTGQDATMPDGLAQAAYDAIHGKFTDEQRQGLFKPEVSVPADADAQTRLLAYVGRTS
jgi:uncharacterized protein (TIGR03086 family)